MGILKSIRSKLRYREERRKLQGEIEEFRILREDDSQYWIDTVLARVAGEKDRDYFNKAARLVHLYNFNFSTGSYDFYRQAYRDMQELEQRRRQETREAMQEKIIPTIQEQVRNFLSKISKKEKPRAERVKTDTEVEEVTELWKLKNQEILRALNNLLEFQQEGILVDPEIEDQEGLWCKGLWCNAKGLVRLRAECAARSEYHYLVIPSKKGIYVFWEFFKGEGSGEENIKIVFDPKFNSKVKQKPLVPAQDKIEVEFIRELAREGHARQHSTELAWVDYFAPCIPSHQ